MFVNRTKATRLVNRRIVFILVLMGVLSSTILVRLFYLQHIQHKVYKDLSLKNVVEVQPLAPTRGLIFDRNQNVLAKNIRVSSLEIVPQKTHSVHQTIGALRQIIQITPTEVHQFYRQMRQHRRTEEVPLKLKLTEQESAHFLVEKYKFPGVSIRHRLIRTYPHTSIAAHAVGYVGRINIKELEHLNPSDYSATRYVGKVGLEKFYEPLLHGHVGYQNAEVNAQGTLIKLLEKQPPIPGKNIYLTIDIALQKAAENALENYRGAVVVLDPNNGEILALASEPSYDPNIFVKGVGENEYNTLQYSDKKPLYNRALRGLYPPASTVKPFVGLLGLDESIITPEDTINDIGYYQLPHSKHRYRDWAPYGHGNVNLSKAITISCDTYFYTLAHLIGIERLHGFLQKFGLGESTQIDMGEELSGIVPSAEWKHETHGVRWYPGDTLITGIGQGYMLSTPLQMAEAAATMGMRGIHYKLHLLRATQTPGEAIQYTTPEPLPPVVLKNPDNWDIVIRAMRNVILHGTGFRYGTPPYTIAAKTGTAQVYSSQKYKYSAGDLPEKLRDHSWFIGFAPIEHPKVAIAVIVENSNIAPVVARKVIDAYLIEDNHVSQHA